MANPMLALMQHMKENPAAPAPGPEGPMPAGAHGVSVPEAGYEGEAEPDAMDMGEGTEPGEAVEGAGSAPTPDEAGTEMMDQDAGEEGEVPPSLASFVSSVNADPSNFAQHAADFMHAIQQETLAAAMPHFQDMMKGHVEAALTGHQFYRDNPDLEPHRDLMGVMADALEKENPDLTGHDGLQEVAKRVREKLSLKQAGPSLPGGTGSGSNLGGGALETDPLTLQVKRMHSALRHG